MSGIGSLHRSHTTGDYAYNGPSQIVLEVTNAVLSEGSILPISGPAPNVNTSWHIDFLGPALKCKEVNSTLHARMREDIYDFMNQNYYKQLYGYLAWSPNYGYWNHKLRSDVPFLGDVREQHLFFQPVNTQFGGSMLYSVDPEVLLYVVLLPSVLSAGHVELYGALNHRKAPVPSWIDLKGIQCQAFEGHYYVAFNYDQSSPQVSIERLSINASHPIRPRVDVVGPNPNFKDVNGCERSPILDSSNRFRSDCYTNTDVLRTLAYQAVVDAFGRNLVGSIYLDWQANIKRDSLVLNTALVDTNELLFLRNPEKVKALTGARTLQDAVSYSNGSMSRGILNKKFRHINLPLDSALEQMFQNITVSLMSSPVLQYVKSNGVKLIIS